MADDPTTPDSALALDIKETLTGRAGPEVSAVTLGNVPPGAVLSAGADNGDGTWSLTVADLEGLTITPPPRWTGEINLVVSALTKSADAATLPPTAFGISVMPAGAEVSPPPAPDPVPEVPPRPVPNALRETPPEPPAEEEAGDVFVFGAGQGGDYAPGADGWSETAALEESPDDPDGEAITVAEGDELTIEGPEKLEW